MSGTDPLRLLKDSRVLVTGGAGSIGAVLVQTLEGAGVDVWDTDRDSLDVTHADEVQHALAVVKPTVVFHLAGAKHAPLGEENPGEAADINIGGTRNVLEAAADAAALVVTASTCKACNPETAYGATKLIAERLTLNAGGSVARFYNVRESCGNVFEIWHNLPEHEPLPVTPCKRRFMSMYEAVGLLLTAGTLLPPGRYSVTGTKSQPMSELAAELYPSRATVEMPPRRGDRLEEPEMATHETALGVAIGIARVTSPHDLVRERVPA